MARRLWWAASNNARRPPVRAAVRVLGLFWSPGVRLWCIGRAPVRGQPQQYAVPSLPAVWEYADLWGDSLWRLAHNGVQKRLVKKPVRVVGRSRRLVWRYWRVGFYRAVYVWVQQRGWSAYVVRFRCVHVAGPIVRQVPWFHVLDTVKSLRRYHDGSQTRVG